MIRQLQTIVVCLATLALVCPDVPLQAATPVAPARPVMPTPAKPVKTVTRTKVAALKVNPHVHLPTVSRAAKSITASKTAVSSIPARTMTRRPLTSAHCPRQRLTRTQHFSGTVTGDIHDARGAGVTGAAVRLAKWRGGRLRHGYLATVSSAYGHYVLTGVGAGRYRVVASRSGAGKGFSRFAIQHGIKHVNVKLTNGGGPKKKKKR